MKQKIYIHFFTALMLFFSASALAQLQPEALRQIQSLVNEKESRTPTQRKIASQLLQALREYRGQKMAADVNLAPAKVNADNSGNLKVDISAVVTDRLISKIRSTGGVILYSSKQYNTIRAEINLSKVEVVAAYPEVKFLQPAVLAMTVGSGNPKNNLQKNDIQPTVVSNSAKGNGGFALPRPSFAERSRRVKEALKKYLQQKDEYNLLVLNAGSVNSQGDHAHRADDARNTYGYAGQGIRIGVLSDSYNSLGVAPVDVANGDLPGPGNPLGNTTPVTVLSDIAGGTDEGRAMVQIVHDLAPKAQLFFATAFISGASFAANIQALRNAPYNCDIIIDDVSYSNEPVFQDGIIAQAVNTVTASGGLYFSSAGNAGSLAKNTSGVWEGDFNDTGSPIFTGSTKTGTIHNFGTVAAPINGDSILAAGSRYSLQWADPFGASTNDYDLFVVSSTGVVKASSTNIQSGTQDPDEEIVAPTLATGDRLVVFKTTAAQVRAFAINAFRGRFRIGTTGQTHGHASAADAYCVAATPTTAPFSAVTPPGPFPGVYNTTNQVETFSSDGLRRIFFNANGTAVTPGNFLFGTNGGTVRNKPDITAADGVNTTLAASSGLNPFYGTSAAAPHAGAIAALLKSAKPSLTPAQIRTIITTTALDIESPGYDNVSGFGIMQAFQAMQAVNPTPLATVALGTVTATEGSFRNNNGAVEPGELGNLVVQLTNPSLANATNVNATLTTTTPGVTIIRGAVGYGNIASSGTASNTSIPFLFGVSNTVPCGTVINFTLTVTFNGGLSPQVLLFTISVGAQIGTITSALGSVPPTGTGYTSSTGTQTGRISRNTPVSSCGIQKITPILTATTGARAFDSYTFTNSNLASQCVTVTMNSTNGINLYTVAYTDSGFVPAIPNVHFLADQGSSAALQSFSFTAPPGKKFTVVVHEVNPATAVGTAYTLNVSLSSCSAPPSCNPVIISTASLVNGVINSPYTQSLAASGGSGSGYFIFTVNGNLPAGLTFSGNTLYGTPTQAGSFPITITATDPAGCTTTRNYTLFIAGVTPASITATYGTPQSTYPTTAFPLPLQATVKDSANNPLPGVKVVFTAPATGASGTFTGGLQTDTIVTNITGVAIAHTFTANNIAGNYVVTASVTGVATSATFSLSNFCPANFVVTSAADNGAGSLRDIINNACPGITVTFNQNISQITLTSGDLPITKGITITGPGADKLTISGNNMSRIFNITAGTSTVSISGMTIRDGLPQASSTNGGGGILINTGTVNISGCIIRNNDAALTFYAEGGGVDNEGGVVSIDKCTIANNNASDDGGGIANWGGSMRLTNSTVTGNTLAVAGLAQGGGIFNYVPLTMTNCTIFGNTANAGGNIYRGLSTITFKNNIIAGGILIGTGATGPDVSGIGFASADYNLIQNTAGATITGITTHNITGVSPKLLPLSYYGGVIPTLLPQTSSPAINAGDSALVSGTDQRGLPRLTGAQADIGAVETNYAAATFAGTPQQRVINQPFASTLQAKITESGNAIAGDTVVFKAPVTGASGTFPGASLTATVATNAAGIAISPVFTANSITGTYNVIDSIGPAFPNINFVLTNTLPLPVIFGSISSRAINCTIQLQWETLTETNTRDFTIESSTDGNLYKALATINAKGNSVARQVYNYTHLAPPTGVIYYRIKQTDKNGDYIFTNVMTVVNNCAKIPFVVYPNPVKDKLMIQVSGTAKQALVVYDAKGSMLTRLNVKAGSNEIDVKRWASGVYTLVVTGEDKSTYTIKVVKE